MKKYPMSYRLTKTAQVLIDKLADRLGISKTGVIEVAVRELARREKLYRPEGAGTLRALFDGDNDGLENVANYLSQRCETADEIMQLSREFSAMGLRLQTRAQERREKLYCPEDETNVKSVQG